jgi:hypothetical protein
MRANLAAMMHSSDAADETHLSAAQILELVERGQRCDRYDEYIDHITLCPVCRETYKQLLRAEAVVREARRPRVAPLRWVAPLAAAAAVLALVFIGRALLLPTAPETLALRQQDGVWYEGATRLPEWASDAAALFANPPDAPTRSDDAPAQRAVQLLAPNPANRALESLTPEFRWQAIPDAARYRARLERADTSEPVPLVVEGTQARLASNTMLQAGVRYRLTIEALATGEVAGEGLTGVYEFRTLTPDEQARLRRHVLPTRLLRRRAGDAEYAPRRRPARAAVAQGPGGAPAVDYRRRMTSMALSSCGSRAAASSSGVKSTRWSGTAPLPSRLTPLSRVYQPRPGVLTVLPSIRRRCPVLITPPAVGMPTSGPRLRVLTACAKISALLKLRSLHSTAIG